MHVCMSMCTCVCIILYCIILFSTVLYCIALCYIVFEHLYSASHSIKPYRSAFQCDQLLENIQVLKALEKRTVLQDAGGRRFHREGQIAVRDLDLQVAVY